MAHASLRTTIGSFALGACAVALVAWGYIAGTPKVTTNTQINLSNRAVVTKLISLQKLETARMSIDKPIEAGTTGNKLQEFLYGDRIMLLASGTVTAGFDLSQLTEADISTSTEGRLSVRLPRPEILSSSLSTGTRVFDRKLGLFTKGSKDLEGEARAAAQQAITAAACDAGILTEATTRGATQLGATLGLLGFSSVVVTAQPASSCSYVGY
jgi:hypothetical protein